MEFKAFGFKAAQIDEVEGLVTGFAAVMGNRDSGGDRILNGAFARTIAEDGPRIKVRWMHQDPIGRTLAIKEVGRDALPPEVLALAPDATGGLWVQGKVTPTATNKERLALIKDGVVDGLSIGYNVVIEEHPVPNDYRVRDLKELKLHEWSPVDLAMNEAALVTAVKGKDGEPSIIPDLAPYSAHYKVASEFWTDVYAPPFQKVLDFLNSAPLFYRAGVKARAIWVIQEPDPWPYGQERAPAAWSKLVGGVGWMIIDIKSCDRKGYRELVLAHEWWHCQELGGGADPSPPVASDHVGWCSERPVAFGKWFSKWWDTGLGGRYFFDAKGQFTEYSTIPVEWGRLLRRQGD